MPRRSPKRKPTWYEVAKEKCDEQAGDAKDACVNQAKANHEKAKAQIKAMKG